MKQKQEVTVTKESSTGRNEGFHDNKRNLDMTRAGFVKRIEKGEYPNYHVRKVNQIKTPASNPDKSKQNNLG
jgi:hypothetical protein